jgi:hypothetical protein
MKRNEFDTPSSENSLTSENIAKGHLWKELEEEISEYYHALPKSSCVICVNSCRYQKAP